MNGPYPLTAHEVGLRVQSTSPGWYVLSRDSTGNVGHYVGRSDQNVAARLLDWTETRYARFWYEYASSAKAAFEGECSWFHKLGGTGKLDNNQHPERPDGAGWQCPVCNIFG